MLYAAQDAPLGIDEVVKLFDLEIRARVSGVLLNFAS